VKQLHVSEVFFRYPLCAACAKPMRLIRREPHPTRGPKYELDTFECSCGHTEAEDVGPTD
jgi:hypothetical protein